MPGIRTAESHYLGENAEIVPEMIASPALEQQNLIIRWENAEVVPEMAACLALEQQNPVILGEMLKKCRWKVLQRHSSVRIGLIRLEC